MLEAYLKSQRLILRALAPEDAHLLLRYVVDNRQWLGPWEPSHPPSYFTVEGQRSVLLQCQEDRRAETGLLLGLFLREGDPRELLGRLSVSGIVRGIWQNGFVGYSIAHAHAGQGLMSEALRRLVLHAFGEMGLHRLQASIIPRNEPSRRVMEKCRFRLEGRAARYLKINDVWEDHDLFAITAEEVRAGY